MKKLLNMYCLLLAVLLSSMVTFAQSSTKNFLSTSGNKLIDSSGKEVRLTGINWFGFETSSFMPHGLWSRDMTSVLKQIKDMGFNCVRIPWTDAMLEPGAKIQPTLSGTDPYTGVTPMNGSIKDVKTPLALLDEIVKWCQNNNMKIILDNHARIADGYLSETIWYSNIVPESKWISNWVFMANRYKDYDAVVGLDLDNEPHGTSPGSPQTASWGNSNPATDWNKAVERCGNAILEVNPNVLIVAEGVESYKGDVYWWGGNLIGAKEYPIVLSKKNKLVYSPHEYGPTVYQQPWFTDPKFPANMPGIWDKNFGYLYNTNTAPLLVGEFGIKTLGGNDEVWVKSFLNYMGSKYSWTFWCFNPNSGDTGGVVADDWHTPVQWKLDLLKPYLAPMIPNGTVQNNTNTNPVANFTALPTTGTAPLNVSFNASSSTDADGDTLTYTWNFGDNSSNATGVSTSHTYTIAKTYTATLTVNDGKGGSNSKSIDIVVSAATSLKTITATAGANGTISPLGSTSVNSGSNKTYTITPNAGYKVATLLIDGTAVTAASTYTFSNITANHTIAATFSSTAAATYTITAASTTNGTISPSGSTSVTSGSTKNYTITPNTGYKVATLVIDGTAVTAASTYTFSNVTTNHTIAATFTTVSASTYTITASAGANGTISPAGVKSLNSGSNQTYTFTPNSGYQVDVLKVNNQTVTTADTYAFTNVTSNQTIAVSFKAVASGGNCLLSTFGVPRNSGIPSKNSTFKYIYVLGNSGPDLSKASLATFNWEAQYNGLYDFSMNLSVSPWYTGFAQTSSQKLNQANPSITINGSGIANFDKNTYYVNFINSDVVLVEISGSHAIYFSNNATRPAGCSNTTRKGVKAGSVDEAEITIYPVPATDYLTVRLADGSGINTITVKDMNGHLISTKTADANQEEFSTIDIKNLNEGIFLISTESNLGTQTKRFIKKN